MARQDILLDSDTLDFQIGADGDLVPGASDDQHVQLIAYSAPLNWRQVPQLGPSLQHHLKSTGQTTEFVRKMKIALKIDGYKATKIDLSKGLQEFKVEAETE